MKTKTDIFKTFLIPPYVKFKTKTVKEIHILLYALM